MATTLEQLAALMKDAEDKRTELQKLAATQVQQPTHASMGPKAGGLARIGQLLGIGASPEQRQYMLRTLGEQRGPGESRMDAWSRGMLKADDIALKRAQGQHDQQLAASQRGVANSQAALSNASDLYGLQEEARRQEVLEGRQEATDAFTRGKKGTITYNGKVYETDAQGNVLRELGASGAPKGAEPFTLSKGQQRYDAAGNVIASNDEPSSPSGPQGKRYAELSSQSGARRENIDKATKFLDAFTSGAESGTSRTAASIIPGTWTDQGAFDQELDSFAEEAARAALKAQGEIRPTDADVKGMKEALFGKGKDEPVNINLLLSYLNKQVALENEQRELEGLDPIAVPQGKDLGEGWYRELFGNTATGQKTNTPTGGNRITW